jgi:transcriptional regulator GlxA family with amidase domain
MNNNPLLPVVKPITIDPSSVPINGPSRMSWRVRLSERHIVEPKARTRHNARDERALLVQRARNLTIKEISNPDISQAAIAEKLSVSQRHLQRSYLEAGGSWSAELSRQRMTHAQKLFQSNPSLHVSEVSGSVGYRRPHQFAKAFHKATGYWPKDWRKKCRGGLLQTAN